MTDLSYIVEPLRPLAMPIDDLRPDPSNANLHDERSIRAIMGSYARYQQRKPIVVNRNGNIVQAGNGQLEAARRLGWTHIAVVLVNDDPTTHTGFSIADNRSAQLSHFDDEALGRLIAQVQAADPDAPLDAMWDDAELKALMQQAGEVEETDAPDGDIDKAEALLEDWLVEPGDLWFITSETSPGKFHRLICGDCRDLETISRLCEGTQISGVFTSPPYAEQRKSEYGGVPVEEYVAWWDAVQSNIREYLTTDGSFFLNIKPHTEDGERALYVMDLVLAMKRRWGWRFIEEYTWKHQGVPGAGGKRLKNQFEPVYQFSMGRPALRQDEIRMPASESHLRGMERKRQGYVTPPGASPFTGGRVAENFDVESKTALPGNVIEVNNGAITGGLHAATFPVGLPDFFIRAYSEPGDVWLDPFVGSGTTIIAAEKRGRLGLGVELLPKYCAVTLDRLSKMGLNIEREETP